MLVLTRKVGQVITLGNPLSPEKAIEIKVVDVQGSDVEGGLRHQAKSPSTGARFRNRRSRRTNITTLLERND